MAGVLPLEFEMTPLLMQFGYVDVTFIEDCLLGRKGTKVRGHSFHCSRVRAGNMTPAAYRLKYSLSGREELEGFSRGNLLASYVHLHFRANPALAVSLVAAARRDAGRGGAGMKRWCVVLIFSIALPACGARTIQDELGRTVKVPEHPHRIVCLMPSVVDDVYSLGAGTDVVGVPDYTKYPAEARTKRSIGLPLTPSIETMVALHPDLVLGDADMNSPDTMQALERLGIPVFMVAPHSFEDIYRSLASIGQALNREEPARELIGRLRAREAAVRRRVSGKPVVNILMPVWYDPVVTIGKHAFITGADRDCRRALSDQRPAKGVATDQPGGGDGTRAGGVAAGAGLRNVRWSRF